MQDHWFRKENIEEKKTLLVKVIEWAQKKKMPVQTLSKADIEEAIKCKF